LKPNAAHHDVDVESDQKSLGTSSEYGIHTFTVIMDRWEEKQEGQ
jgi:hypothetical protein